MAQSLTSLRNGPELLDRVPLRAVGTRVPVVFVLRRCSAFPMLMSHYRLGLASGYNRGSAVIGIKDFG